MIMLRLVADYFFARRRCASASHVPDDTQKTRAINLQYFERFEGSMGDYSFVQNPSLEPL